MTVVQSVTEEKIAHAIELANEASAAFGKVEKYLWHESTAANTGDWVFPDCAEKQAARAAAHKVRVAYADVLHRLGDLIDATHPVTPVVQS